MVNFAIDQLKSMEANTSVLAPVIETLNSQKGSSAYVTNSKVVHQLLAEAGEAQTEAITDLIEEGKVDRQFGWKYNRVQMFQTQFAFQNPFQRIVMWCRMVGYRFFPNLAKRQRAKQISQWQEKKKQWQIDHPDQKPEETDQDRLLPEIRKENAQLPANVQQVPAKRQHYSRKQLQEIKKAQTPEDRQKFLDTMSELETAGYNAVMLYLTSVENDENRAEVGVIRHYYMVRHNRFSQSETKNETESELFIRAFQFEYTYVQGTAKQQYLSSELVKTLQQKISMDQLVYMQSNG